MIVTQDERFAPRYEVELPVELLASGVGDPIAARSVNLGAGGLCLEPGAGIADRTAVLCRLDTGGGALEAHGEVAWQLNEDGAYRVGIRFSALTPAMALWLASVSRTTSTASTPPASDTQPMGVPIPEEPVEAPRGPAPAAPTAIAASVTRPVPQLDGQLSLPMDSAPAAAPAEVVDVDLSEPGSGVETQVLFDDMPSPEARMMRASTVRSAVENVQAASDSTALEAFSPRHRLTAVARSLRERGLGLLATCRAVFGGLATGIRKPRGLGRIVTSATSRMRIRALGAALKGRRARLALAASAVVLLIGSGLFVLFSGPGPAGEPSEAGAGAAQPDPNRSYWDPPLMPAPSEAPADQEIVEASPRRAPAVPAPPREPPRPSPMAAADEIPLPEPPAIGEPEPEGAETEPVSRAVLGGAADGDSVSADPTTSMVQPDRAASRQRDDERQDGRADVGANRRDLPEGRAGVHARRPERRGDGRAERSERRADSRAERYERRPDARADRSERRADRTDGSDSRPTARAEGASAASSSGAVAPSAGSLAAASGASDFRLNLSGTPGPIQHYPLANPNGIVIDVPELRHPGDATKLTSDDPRIRFVKILNRETGVRFIVYVNGPLASYEVQPSGRGLRVAIAAAN